MKVIISTVLENIYSEFTLVRSFRDVRDLEGVDTIIIHTYDESDFDAGVFISEFSKSGITRFVYISEDPSITVKMVLEGLDGFYVEDEFYFEDEEELSNLIVELYGESSQGTSLAVANAEIIKDFMRGFARKEERINTPLYLEQVNDALNSLVELNNKQEMQISVMGQSAIDIFEKASSIIKSLAEQKKMIEDQLQKLENNQSESSGKTALGSNIIFFAPFQYIGSAKVLVIKEYSPCFYLTSFILGYLHYLHYTCNRRCKLIIVHQKGQNIATKYDEYTAITAESKNVRTLYDSEIVTTNNPVKEVMRELFQKECDTFIVLDRLYAQDIVKNKVVKVNAVSGVGDLAKYNLQAKDTIFPIEGDEAGIIIPTITNYPKEVDARYAFYIRAMEKEYKKLNEKIGIEAQ